MRVSLIGARVRSLVTWVAFVEETKRMKPTDKAIVRMASESAGRNASEPSGGLDKKNSSGGRAPCFGAKATWGDTGGPMRRDTRAGWLGTAR
jgi:hypothetical protein